MFLFVSILFMSACSQDSADKAATVDQDKVYSLEELMNEDFTYTDGSKVIVEGLCVHVCSHSGKKMFLSGIDDGNKIQIMTSDAIGMFDKKYEGSKLRVTGTLEEERIDMNYIKEWESELVEETEADGGHSCSFEESMAKIDDLKQKVANSKKGYISRYTMTGLEVKEI